MSHHHHQHKHRSHYSFRQFTKDVSRPFMTVEKDVVGVYHHGLNTLGKIGSSVSTPLLIIVGAGVVFLVLNRGALK
jgi:hypothetical protein